MYQNLRLIQNNLYSKLPQEMKNTVRTLFLIVLTSNIAIAQNTLSKNIDEVVVSANRAQTEDNITNVQVIHLEEIENAPVQTIEDLLEYAINIDVRQRGGAGSTSRH